MNVPLGQHVIPLTMGGAFFVLDNINWYQEKENKYNQKQRQLKLELIKLENDQKKILKQINQLKKKINIPFQKVDSLMFHEIL